MKPIYRAYTPDKNNYLLVWEDDTAEIIEQRWDYIWAIYYKYFAKKGVR